MLLILERFLSSKRSVLLFFSECPSISCLWTLRSFLVFCFPGLNIKSFSLNESSMSPAPLMTFPRMTDMPLLPSPSFLRLEVCRRGSVGAPLYWDCSTNRMSWDRRDVTESSHSITLQNHEQAFV